MLLAFVYDPTEKKGSIVRMIFDGINLLINISQHKTNIKYVYYGKRICIIISNG